ncbi:MAG TPA: regulator, partial [Verrucomicrobiota bacterium]|nr:regulator [Verrucomicrobiota bacterium]
ASNAMEPVPGIRGGRAQRIEGVAGPVGAVGVSAEGIVLAGGPGGYWRVGAGWAEEVEPGCTRYVRGITAGTAGTWWVATEMGLYAWRRARSGYWVDARAAASISVRAVVDAGGGRLWAAALGGIQVFEGERLTRSIGAGDGLPSEDVRAIARGEDGALWCGTARGAACYESGRWKVLRGQRWLMSDDVRDVAVGHDGVVWVATAAGVSALRTEQLTLAAKAARFHRVLEARHVRPPGIVGQCRLRTPGQLATWEPTDDDNDGGYTALALAMEAYRYAVTGDPEALAAARRALGACEFLERVTGTPGFLARTVVPADGRRVHDPNEEIPAPVWAEEQVRDPRNKRVPLRWRVSADGRWLWKGDTSSDEVTAHFFGYWAFHELARDAADRRRVATQVVRIMDHLIEHGYTLTDLDGTPTRWGVWAPERLNGDPDWAMERGINSVELLSFLKLAHHVSGDSRYADHYRRLIRDHHYDRNALEAPNLNPAWRTYIDFELLAFAYPALLTLETDPGLRRVYRRSLERWHAAVRRDGSPFFEFIYALCTTPRRANCDGALALLRETPLDLVRWTMDNTVREDVRLCRYPEIERWQTDRRLPPGEIAYSRTDQNPWLAVQGDGGESEGDGVFWLLPYWMGRHLGILESAGGVGKAKAQ